MNPEVKKVYDRLISEGWSPDEAKSAIEDYLKQPVEEAGPQPVAKDTADALGSFSQVPFVDRMVNAKSYPVRDNPDGTHSTHLMSTANVEGREIAYPTLTYQAGPLRDGQSPWVERDGEDALTHALDTGNYVPFSSTSAADSFARGAWKKSPTVQPEERLGGGLFRGAGATGAWSEVPAEGEMPTEDEMAVLSGPRPVLTREAAIRARDARDAKYRESSLFAAPPELDPVQDIVAPPVEALATAAGIAAGTVGTLGELGSIPSFEYGEKIVDSGGRPALKPERTPLGDTGLMVDADSSMASIYTQTMDQLKKEGNVRLGKDFYDNWRDSASQLSEGTVQLLFQLVDAGEDDDKSFIDGIVRAFKSGEEVPRAMVAGGLGFTEALIKSKGDMLYTHPAESLLTIMPVLPKLAALAKNTASPKYAAAVRALKDLEDRGLIVGTGAKAARVAIEAPGAIADIKIPGLKKRGLVEELVEKDKRIPSDDASQISYGGGDVPVTLGDFGKSMAKGAATGLMVDEALMGAILGAGARAFPGVGLTAIRRWAVDVMAHDNPRAEALLRSARGAPDRLVNNLVQVADELADVIAKPGELLSEIKRVPDMERLPPGKVSMVQAGGKTMADLEDGLQRSMDAGKSPQFVRAFGPETAKLLGEFKDLIDEGYSLGRENVPSARTPQRYLTDQYITRLKQTLSGNSIDLLRDKAIYDQVLGWYVNHVIPPNAGARTRRKLAMKAGEALNYAMSVKAKGRDASVKLKLKDDAGKWIVVDVEQVIPRALEKSGDARRAVLRKIAEDIGRSERINQRSKILVDTADPILRMVRQSKGDNQTFPQMVEARPQAYQGMWAKMYELEYGLAEGAPIMHLPPEMARSAIRLQLDESVGKGGGRHFDAVVDIITKRHPELSKSSVRRRLGKLEQRLRNFEENVDIGGHTDPAALSAFKLIDEAEDFRQDISRKVKIGPLTLPSWSGFLSALKKNLTVFQLSSTLNNMKAATLLQTIGDGTTIPVYLAEQAKLGTTWNRFKKGDTRGLSPSEIREFNSIDKTKIIDTDWVAAETLLVGGDGVWSKTKKAAESAYRFGDNLPKLRETRKVYAETMRQLDTLKPGEYATVMVDSNLAIPIKRMPDGSLYRKAKGGKWRKLTDDEVSDVVARGAKMAAENKLFNYQDISRLAWKSKTGIFTLGSPFYTWLSKAAAGRRGGLVGNTLLGDFTPIIDTDSAAIVRRQFIHGVEQSARRTAFSQAAGVDERAANAGLSEAASYDSKDNASVLIGPMRRGVAKVYSLGASDWDSAFAIGLRFALGGVSRIRGDTRDPDAIIAGLKPIEEGLSKEDRDERLKAKRRAALAVKTLMGERGTTDDALKLIALSGNPMLKFAAAMDDNFRDKWGRQLSADDVVAQFGAMLVGGTISKTIMTALAVGPERGVFNPDVPIGVSADPKLVEDKYTFAVRRVLNMAPRLVRFPTTMRSVRKGGKTRTKEDKSERGIIGYRVAEIKRAFTGAVVAPLEKEEKFLKGHIRKKGNREKLKKVQIEIEKWKHAIEVVAGEAEINMMRSAMLLVPAKKERRPGDNIVE